MSMNILNMKRIVCYCLAISMIPLKECSDIDGDCMEPQLLVKETYCGYNSMTSITMYTINNTSLATSLHDGCAVDFDEPLHLNNTFYFECDTETSCFDESKEISRKTYYLECEEVDIFSKEIMNPKEHNESTIESYLLRNETTTELDENETTTELDDESTPAYGNLSEVYIFRNETTTDLDGLLNVHSLKAAKENSSDSSNVLAILGYSLAGIGATLALAFGAYRLKNAVQSGSYLLPETPRPPGFIELA